MSISFGLYGIIRDDETHKAIKELDEHARIENIMYHETIAKNFVDEEGHSLDEMNSADIDFIMTVGGDGTILRLLQQTDKKVLGVNTGTVGFLTSIELDELPDAIDRVDQDDYFIDERLKLKTIVNGEEKVECTNEVVIHTDQVAKIRSFAIHQGENEIDRFRGDGIIVSTPTGSTCYSMAAGGPIVDPTVDAFVIVPISPYELATKPYVVPTDKKIRLELLEKDKPCKMVLDGQKEIKVDDSDEIVLTEGERKARFISFEDDFYDRIKKKLMMK